MLPTIHTVGCSSPRDCSDSEDCYSGQCLNPCRSSANPCPPTAVCQPVRHSASCQCPPGTTGMPFSGCTPVSFCSEDEQCGSGEICLHQKCIDVCQNTLCRAGARCVVEARQAACACLPGYTGNPEKGCSQVQCRTDRDCESDQLCDGGKCRIACGSCGVGALCSHRGTQGSCYCPPGTRGDPTISCAASKNTKQILHSTFHFKSVLHQICISIEILK